MVESRHTGSSVFRPAGAPQRTWLATPAGEPLIHRHWDDPNVILDVVVHQFLSSGWVERGQAEGGDAPVPRVSGLVPDLGNSSSISNISAVGELSQRVDLDLVLLLEIVEQIALRVGPAKSFEPLVQKFRRAAGQLMG